MCSYTLVLDFCLLVPYSCYTQQPNPLLLVNILLAGLQ
jgi:hypothetical protein